MVELELQEISITDLFRDKSPEMLSLFRDLGRERKISAKRIANDLPKAMDDLGFPLADEFRRALNGEASELAEMGLWRIYLYARAMKSADDWPPKLGFLANHVASLETALADPTKAANAGDFKRCAALLSSAPEMAGYMWPEALVKIESATSSEDIQTTRMMVALEIQLSWLAYWDAELQASGLALEPMLGELFPDFDSEKDEYPNAKFLAWLARYSGEKNLASHLCPLSKPERDLDIGSAQRQIRSWRSGKGFPSFDLLENLFHSIYGKQSHDEKNVNHEDWLLSWSMAKATKRINFLLPILSALNPVRAKVFPFGHESVQEWRESRYRHWYEHWLPLLPIK